jgi:hypothetical protein
LDLRFDHPAHPRVSIHPNTQATGAKREGVDCLTSSRCCLPTGRASGHVASPREAAHRYPNFCSHFWSVTRVSTQGLLFFGRGSGRTASPRSAATSSAMPSGRAAAIPPRPAQLPRHRPCPPAAQRPYRLAHEVGEGAREARVGQGWGVTDPKGPQG